MAPRTSVTFASLCCLVLAAGARAQPLNDSELALVKAAIVVAAFDELQQKCSRVGDFNAAQKREVLAWQSSQGVNALRSHLNGPGLTPVLREQVRAAADQVVQQMDAAVHPCVAAVSLTRTADAKFAGKPPPTAAAADTTASASSPMPTTKPASVTLMSAAPAPTNKASVNLSRAARDIEGFAFDSCTRMGFGGMVMFVPCPVVLFHDGSALTNVEGLSHPQGLAAHRAAQPADWTKWRRSGERIQLLKKEGWKNITYTAVYAALPENFRLDGRFRSTSGTGNTAMGGGQAVVAWSDYLFHPDGRVQHGGGAGASSTGTGTDVTTSSRVAGKAGRYRVEGMILAIEYDDGSSERRVIIADPKDGGKGTMWLDGVGYAVRK